MGKESALKLGQRGPDARQEVPMRTPKQSATSGKAGGLKKVEPLKADKCCEPLKAVRL